MTQNKKGIKAEVNNLTIQSSVSAEQNNTLISKHKWENRKKMYATHITKSESS